MMDIEINKIFMQKNILNLFSFRVAIILFAVTFIITGLALAAEKIYTELTKIEINKNNKYKVYTSDQDIILSGTSVPLKEIVVFFGDRVGLAESDKNGKWVINFGDMPEGKYSLQLITDSSSNSRSIATAHIVVNDSRKNLIGYLMSALSRAVNFTAPTPIKLYPK
jgi:hypothetical protein